MGVHSPGSMYLAQPSVSSVLLVRPEPSATAYLVSAASE